MRSMWEKYYEEANAVVFVIDSADPARIQEAKAAYEKACEDHMLSDIPVMIFANKQDVSGSMSLQEIAHNFYDTPNRVAKSAMSSSSMVPGSDLKSARLFGISSITGAGVSEALASLVHETQYQMSR